MKCLLLCAVVSLSWSAFAQNLQPSTNEKSFPDSASTSKAAAENADMPFVVRPVPIRPPTLRIEAGPTAERRHVADRKFLIASLFQIGATIGDIESTQYGLGHGAQEANPLFGSHPSRATQYAIAIADCGRSGRLELSTEEKCASFRALADSTDCGGRRPHWCALSQLHDCQNAIALITRDRPFTMRAFKHHAPKES
jgi:hypothetical protein